MAGRDQVQNQDLDGEQETVSPDRYRHQDQPPLHDRAIRLRRGGRRDRRPQLYHPPEGIPSAHDPAGSGRPQDRDRHRGRRGGADG